jgi:hypothetical protein
VRCRLEQCEYLGMGIAGFGVESLSNDRTGKVVHQYAPHGRIGEGVAEAALRVLHGKMKVLGILRSGSGGSS